MAIAFFNISFSSFRSILSRINFLILSSSALRLPYTGKSILSIFIILHNSPSCIGGGYSNISCYFTNLLFTFGNQFKNFFKKLFQLHQNEFHIVPAIDTSPPVWWIYRYFISTYPPNQKTILPLLFYFRWYY